MLNNTPCSYASLRSLFGVFILIVRYCKTATFDVFFFHVHNGSLRRAFTEISYDAESPKQCNRFSFGEFPPCWISFSFFLPSSTNFCPGITTFEMKHHESSLTFSFFSFLNVMQVFVIMWPGVWCEHAVCCGWWVPPSALTLLKRSSWLIHSGGPGLPDNISICLMNFLWPVRTKRGVTPSQCHFLEAGWAGNTKTAISSRAG